MSASVFHLKGLNGLRALAAFAVVISHTLRAAPTLGLPERERGLLLAGYGVTLFFAISGFLITYLLLLEKEKTGTVDIKSFYIRRVLRIWPLYYFYLVVALLVIIKFMPDELNSMIPFYVFMCANIPYIAGMTLPFLDHYWSLGVEEQFYLFWPWIVRRVKKLERFLLIFIAVFVLLKLLAWLYLKKTNNVLPYTIVEVCRFQCMAIGGLGAVWAYQKKELFRKLVYNRIVEAGAWVIVLILGMGIVPFPSVIGAEIIAVVSVVLIMNTAADRKKLVSLNFPIFDFLGRISYGIYVYHPLVIFFVVKWLSGIVTDQPAYIRYALLLSLVSGVTILIAWLSYHLFEKRFLLLKDRYAIVKSSGSLSVTSKS